MVKHGHEGSAQLAKPGNAPRAQPKGGGVFKGIFWGGERPRKSNGKYQVSTLLQCSVLFLLMLLFIFLLKNILWSDSKLAPA